jgi:hypothetical protein
MSSPCHDYEEDDDGDIRPGASKSSDRLYEGLNDYVIVLIGVIGLHIGFPSIDPASDLRNGLFTLQRGRSLSVLYRSLLVA